MTSYDTQEQEETLRPLDRLETELIEADLAAILGTSGDHKRVYEDDSAKRDAADVIGWTVYGGVFIDRHMLPVCGYLASGGEDADHTAHRRQILDVIAGAHAAGRGHGFDIVVPTCASDAEIERLIETSIRRLVRRTA